MTQRCRSATVDAQLFDTLEAAIDFVASLGGGTVYSDLADTLFAKSLKLPAGVKIEARPVEME